MLPVRFFYMDDSGAPDNGWIVYSWVECMITDWRVALRGWLDLRKELFARFAIPPSYELHAVRFARGSGNPSTDAAWNTRKRSRGKALQLALATIGALPELRIGTAYRITGATGSAYAAERASVYEVLIADLDRRLGDDGEHGLVFMDGNGTDASYYAAHRALKLAARNLIEDPLFQASHRSQWLQMADIVAWSAYQGLLRAPNRRFAWGWYDTHLRPRDVNGGPLAV